MHITLNGKRYFLVPGAAFSWSNAQELSTPFRTVGVQQRSDNIKVNKAVRGWDDGIGFPRLRRDRGYAINGMRDATALTIHANQITAGILHGSQIHASPADHPKKYVGPFKGDYFCFFEEDYNSGAINDVVCHKWNPIVWDSSGAVEAANSNVRGMRCYDAMTHEGRMWAAVTRATNDANISLIHSTDGATWQIAGSTTEEAFAGPSTTTSRRNNFDDDGARLLSFGATLMLAVWDEANSEIEIEYSTNPEAASPTFTAGAIIPSGDGPKAFLRWKDPFSSPPTDSPTLVTEEGIYRVDVGGATFEKIYELDGDPNNGRWAAVGQDGGLIIGLGSGKVIVIYADGSGGIEVRTSNSVQTFISAKQGHVNYILAPSVPWYFVSYGGHAASKQASLFAVEYQWRTDPISGKLYQPWHSLYYEANADIDMTLLGYSTEDEAIPRLFFALENASTAEMFHLEEPVTDPASGVAQKFQDGASNTQYVEFAEDDLGDPHSDAAVYRVGADVDDVSVGATGESIAVHYGVDGDAWNNVSLGDILNGTKFLDPGTSSRGVSAKTFRLRVEFSRGATTSKTAKLKEVEVQSRNKLQLLERYGELAIDLGLTAEQERTTPFEIFTRLRADIVSVINLGFTLAGRWTEQQVEVVGFEGTLETPGQPAGVESEEVTGVVRLTVEEVLNV